MQTKYGNLLRAIYEFEYGDWSAKWITQYQDISLFRIIINISADDYIALSARPWPGAQLDKMSFCNGI